uniref:Platelet-derived growth factor (PDGF) family profile domain-containing protein n=1 Tax=Myripristis murdjan TaxID=586833 RepID=A0A667ZT84_9TELE
VLFHVCAANLHTMTQRSPVTSIITHAGSSALVAVMLFQEVWKRSLCRPMERLVDVEQEYPGGVEHIFSPACVPLWRCSGCCGDDSLECHPTLERNTTLQVWSDNLVCDKDSCSPPGK